MRCLDSIKASGWKLHEDVVNALDDSDRLARANARKSGHTHVIADVPARRDNGKLLGHRR